jgi:hypothetical protein
MSTRLGGPCEKTRCGHKNSGFAMDKETKKFATITECVSHAKSYYRHLGAEIPLTSLDRIWPTSHLAYLSEGVSATPHNHHQPIHKNALKKSSEFKKKTH